MPLGPADPDATDQYLREVMGCTDEMLEELSKQKREEDAAKQAASGEEDGD